MQHWHDLLKMRVYHRFSRSFQQDFHSNSLPIHHNFVPGKAEQVHVTSMLFNGLSMFMNDFIQFKINLIFVINVTQKCQPSFSPFSFVLNLSSLTYHEIVFNNSITQLISPVVLAHGLQCIKVTIIWIWTVKPVFFDAVITDVTL